MSETTDVDVVIVRVEYVYKDARVLADQAQGPASFERETRIGVLFTHHAQCVLAVDLPRSQDHVERLIPKTMAVFQEQHGMAAQIVEAERVPHRADRPRDVRRVPRRAWL